MTVIVNGGRQTTSASIVDGTITNADVSASAGIVGSKLSPTIAAVTAKGDILAATASGVLGKVAVGTNGKVAVANSSATSGVGYAWMTDRVPPVYRDQGTMLACNMDPTTLNAAKSLTDRALVFTAVYLPFDATITGVGFVQVAQGDTTADQNNKVGLYTTSGGTLTLVASSANNGALWEGAANTVITEAFTGTYAATAGLYYIAYLYNQSAEAVAPTIAGISDLTGARISLTARMTNNVKANGFVAAQDDLPATQAWTGVAVANVGFMFLY